MNRIIFSGSLPTTEFSDGQFYKNSKVGDAFLAYLDSGHHSAFTESMSIDLRRVDAIEIGEPSPEQWAADLEVLFLDKEEPVIFKGMSLGFPAHIPVDDSPVITFKKFLMDGFPQAYEYKGYEHHIVIDLGRVVYARTLPIRTR